MEQHTEEFPIERPTTPGTGYLRQKYFDAIHSAENIPDVLKERKAFACVEEKLDVIKEDLKGTNDARSTLEVIGRLLTAEPKDIRLFAAGLVDENFANLTKRVNTEGFKDLNAIGETPLTITTLARTLEILGNADPRSEKYLEFLEDNKDAIVALFRQGNAGVGEALAITLFNIRGRGDKEAQAATDALICDLLFAEDVQEHRVRKFFDKLQDFEPNLASVFFKKTLGKYFKDQSVIDDLVDSYQVRTDYSPELSSIEVYKTLKICEGIDKIIPGGSERINKLFGITHFARYSGEMLIAQLRDWDSGDKTPYGVYVGSWNDWNRNISGSDNEAIFGKVKKLGFKFRVIEARDKEEFVMRQVALSQQFNGADKFHFLIINAHGSPRGFYLGRNNEGFVGIGDIQLLKKDLAALYMFSMQTLFRSCSTGVEDGFAENWADSGIESIGPKRDGDLAGIEPFLRPGGLIGFRVIDGKVGMNRYPRLK